MKARHAWAVPAVVVTLAAASFATASSAGATHGKAQDQKIAASGALIAADFTSEWTPQGGTDATSKLASATKAAGGACKGFAATAALASSQPHAASEVFTNGPAEASNRVSVLRKPADAAAALKAFSQRTTGACLAKSLPTTLPAALVLDPDIGKVKSMKVTVTPGNTAPIADANAAWEAKVTAKLANGKSQTIFVNDEAVAEGRALDLFEFVNVGSQLDGIHDHLIASSVGRLQGALDTTALGETALLASMMTPVPGYTYAEAPDEAQVQIASDMSDPDFQEYARGENLHSVLQNDNSVGLIWMIDYKPSYTALPGFKDSELTSWVQAFSEELGGATSTPTTISGHPTTVVSYPDGTVDTIFWIKNVLVFVESSGADPAATAAFATEYLARTPA